MSKKVLTLGYPIGFSPINKTDFFNIQLNDKMYPLNLIGVSIWLSSMEINSIEHVKSNAVKELKLKGYSLDTDYTNDDLEKIYNLLLSNSLIVEFYDCNNGYIKLFDKLINSKFMRKGFGIGIEGNEILILHNNEKHSLTPVQYLIWQLSDCSKNIQDIYDITVKNIEYSIGCNKNVFEDEELKTLLIEDILYLCKLDLVSVISI